MLKFVVRQYSFFLLILMYIVFKTLVYNYKIYYICEV